MQRYYTRLCLLVFFFIILTAFSETKSQTIEATWNEITITSAKPLPRGGASAIYDPIGDRVILFGGWSGVSYDSLNDTWEFNLTSSTWSEITTTGALPPERVAHVAVYDSLLHRMIIFAGSNWWQTWYNDVWALDLTSHKWEELQTSSTKPENRFSHCGIYYPKNNSVIIFGGCCGNIYNNWLSNEVWELNLNSLQWTLKNTFGESPFPRDCVTSVVDIVNSDMIIFGGGGCSDIRALNLNTYYWRKLKDFGSNRWDHESVFDPLKRQMIAVAGWGGPNFCDVFDVETNSWLDVVTTSTIPPDRSVPAVIYDLTNQRVIMFGGGIDLWTSLDDTWELSLRSKFTLSIEPEPLIAGQYATFTTANGEDYTNTYLTYSLNGLGSYYSSFLNVVLDLSNPKLAGVPEISDYRGEANWVLMVPPSVSGFNIWFQAVQYGMATNVVATFIQ